MNKLDMIANNRPILAKLGIKKMGFKESSKISSDNIVSINEPHSMAGCVGYIVANRVADEMVLVYIPICKTGGEMRQMEYKNVTRIAR